MFTPKLQMSSETITPEVAAEMLRYNINNRKLRPSKVARYGHEMANGTWRLTSEPIIFDWHGRLLNGQHRLHACIESGCSFETAVHRGVDPAAFDVIDTGMNRTLGDVLSQKGTKSAPSVAAAAKAVVSYDLGIIHDSSLVSERVTRAIIFDEAEEYAEAYQRATTLGRRAYTEGYNKAAFAAAYFIVARASGEDVAEEWFGGAISGVGMEPGDARLAMRRWSIGVERANNVVHLSSWVRTRNAAVEGRPLNTVRPWYRGSAYPRFIEDEARRQAMIDEITGGPLAVVS